MSIEQVKKKSANSFQGLYSGHLGEGDGRIGKSYWVFALR